MYQNYPLALSREVSTFQIQWNLYHTQGSESICEKKSEISWNAWKDVLFNALKVRKLGFAKSKKVWNQIKISTLTSLHTIDIWYYLFSSESFFLHTFCPQIISESHESFKLEIIISFFLDI